MRCGSQGDPWVPKERARVEGACGSQGDSQFSKERIRVSGGLVEYAYDFDENAVSPSPSQDMEKGCQITTEQLDLTSKG